MKKIIYHFKDNWISYGFETFVVVAGILVAFALNNWNEDRKLRTLEHEYLTSLLNDFNKTRTISEKNLLRNIQMGDYAFLLVKLVEYDTILDPKSIAIALHYAPYNAKIGFYSRYTWDDMINTGGLKSIQNQKLRKALSEFFGALEASEITYDESMHYYIQLRESTYNILTPTEHFLIFPEGDNFVKAEFDPKIVIINFSPERSKNIINDIHKIKNLPMRLTNVISARKVTQYIIQHELNEIDTIMAMLNEELARFE